MVTKNKKRVLLNTEATLERLTGGQLSPENAASLSKAIKIFGDADDELFGGVLDLDVSGDPTEKFLEMFKDLEAASEIMIAAVLSPKDFATVDLRYLIKPSTSMTTNRIFDIANRIKTIIEDEYGLKKILYDALEQEYVGKGGLLKVVIPENIIDSLLFKRRVETTELVMAMESVDYPKYKTQPTDLLLPDYVTITSDLDYLKIPNAVKREETVERLGMSLSHVKPPEKLSSKDVITLSNSMSERESLTRPLVMDIDIDSVAVIHSPGNPSDHVAYAIALDESGYPVSNVRKGGGVQNKTGRPAAGVNTNSVSYTAKKNMEDNEKKKKISELDLYKRHMANVIKDMIENGVPEDIKSVDVDVISQLAFSRALEKKKTKILVIPASMTQYFARKYNKRGRGVNKISDLAVIGSLRAMLLFSAVGNEVSNQTEDVTVTVDVPQSVSDVDGYMKKVKRSYMKVNEQRLPIGIYDPRDLASWQHTTGVRFVFTGHSDIPSTSIEVNRETQSRPTNMESSLLEDLRKQMLIAMGPGAEMVDAGFDSKFASTMEAHRLMVLKKAERDKATLLKQASSLCSKILLAHGPFFREIELSLKDDDEIKKYYDTLDDPLKAPTFDQHVNELVVDILMSLKISIPEISTSKVSNANDDLGEFISWLDTALPAWISENMITRDLDNVDLVTEQYRSYFIREYVRENKMLVDLDNITKEPVAGSMKVSMNESIEGYSEALMGTVHEFNKSVKDLLDKYEKEANPQEPEPTPAPDGDNTPPEGEGVDNTPPEGEDTLDY